MRALTPEEEAFITEGSNLNKTTPQMSNGDGPIVVTGGGGGPIVVTGGGGGGGGGGMPDLGGGGGGGGGGSTTGGQGGGGESDCPPIPTRNIAENNPGVMAALATGNANLDGVERVLAAWPTITSAANKAGIDPALLGAVGLRESNFRNIDQTGGGLGRGYFQIDLGAHPNVTAAQANDITFAANYAASLLAANMASLSASFPNFTSAQLLQATAASYNFGTGNISGNPATIDQGSTNNNYGSNVVGIIPAFKDPVTGATEGANPENGGLQGC